MIFGNGQSRVKVASGEVSYVKTLVSALALVRVRRRVTGKKAIIPSVSHEIVRAHDCGSRSVRSIRNVSGQRKSYLRSEFDDGFLGLFLRVFHWYHHANHSPIRAPPAHAVEYR